jgi:two-component system phosphate regulon response regulator PhoB
VEILVVEDEPDIRRLVAHHLERDGFRCQLAASGPEGLHAARTRRPDLVILDVMLPDLDGLEVCRRLRGDPATAGVPIIMLTAKGEEVDRVVGLELGADDYVTKPFSPKELVARVRAVLRRTRPAAPAERLSAGGITVDLGRHRVEADGRPIGLAPREFALLQTLVESPGRVLSRDQLLTRAWGYARADEIESRTVDVHIRRLRAKLGSAGDRIVTVKGVGYQLDTD